MNEILERLAKMNEISLFGDKVNALIRERYTVSEELSILRQRDEKPERFAEYNAYCEECKKKAKQDS